MKSTEKIIEQFIQSIKQHFSDQVQVHYNYPIIELKSGDLKLWVLTAEVTKENAEVAKEVHNQQMISIPLDFLATKEIQLLSMLQSKLQLNKKVFARKCSIKKITAPQSKIFLDQFHLMGSAKAAYHLGLFFNNELIAVAAFSSGRKMNRLEAHERSYELVRFCCKEGITVTGGLSRLLKYFIDEKHPGDIMTYIDKQFSEGDSYLKNGFKKHSETPAQLFLVNKKTFERTYYKGESFDKKQFYLTENCGNIKLVYKIEK